MSFNKKKIQATCNTVVYNPKVQGLENILDSRGGISRKNNNKLRLLSFDMNFLNTSPDIGKRTPIIVVICYISTTKYITDLMSLYNFAEFHLFDELEIPNDIKAYAYDKPNVKLYDHLPTDDELHTLSLNNEVLFPIINYTNIEIRKQNSSLIKDAKERYELHMNKEKLNIIDSKICMDYAKKLNGKSTLIKFRPPHFHKGETESDFEFFDGIVLLPIFSGDKSSECRIIVKDYDKIIKWNYKLFSETINTWNMITREKQALNPFNNLEVPLPNQLGNQMEICILFAILRDYFITIRHQNVSVSDVYMLYSQFIIGGNDNDAVCK